MGKGNKQEEKHGAGSAGMEGQLHLTSLLLRSGLVMADGVFQRRWKQYHVPQALLQHDLIIPHQEVVSPLNLDCPMTF